MKENFRKYDPAVSPVIGVLLMLVVTIIIAAVVSGFAGGLAGSTEKAPQASIAAKEFIIKEAYDATKTNTDPNPVAGKAADTYVVFEHKGGDGINLANVEIDIGSVKYPHQKTTIANSITPNSSATVVGTKTGITGFSNNWAKYLEGYPDKSLMVSPAGKFVLHADYVTESTTYGKTIYWQFDSAASNAMRFGIQPGDYLTYDIIDKQSKKSIASGQILVPDFTVSTT